MFGDAPLANRFAHCGAGCIACQSAKSVLFGNFVLDAAVFASVLTREHYRHGDRNVNPLENLFCKCAKRLLLHRCLRAATVPREPRPNRYPLRRKLELFRG